MMKGSLPIRWLASAGVAWSIGAVLCSAAAAQDGLEADRARGLTMAVYERAGSGSTALRGTAIVIGRIQNLHYGLTIFNPCRSAPGDLYVIEHEKPTGEMVQASILSMNRHTGLALLVFVKSPPTPDLQNPAVSEDDQLRADTDLAVFVATYEPPGRIMVVRRDVKIDGYAQIGTKISDANLPAASISGAPAFGKNGRLVGLVTKYPKGQEIISDAEAIGLQCKTREEQTYVFPVRQAMDIVNHFMGPKLPKGAQLQSADQVVSLATRLERLEGRVESFLQSLEDNFTRAALEGRTVRDREDALVRLKEMRVLRPETLKSLAVVLVTQQDVIQRAIVAIFQDRPLGEAEAPVLDALADALKNASEDLRKLSFNVLRKLSASRLAGVTFQRVIVGTEYEARTRKLAIREYAKRIDGCDRDAMVWFDAAAKDNTFGLAADIRDEIRFAADGAECVDGAARPGRPR
jgi:hypothetical protein